MCRLPCISGSNSPRYYSQFFRLSVDFLQALPAFDALLYYFFHFLLLRRFLMYLSARCDIPVSNGLSDIISKDLKKRGFKYLGTVTMYSHLQACGIINDHDKNCPCYKKIVEKYPTVAKKRFLEKQVMYFGG